MNANVTLGHQPTILLAEHGECFRTLPRFLLQQEGFQVLEASHGLEALYVARHHRGPIHLLISQLELPYMSGRELAAHLRALHPDIQVLFAGPREAASQGLPPTASFLPLPIAKPVLLKTIESLFARGGWTPSVHGYGRTDDIRLLQSAVAHQQPVSAKTESTRDLAVAAF